MRSYPWVAVYHFLLTKKVNGKIINFAINFKADNLYGTAPKQKVDSLYGTEGVLCIEHRGIGLK